MAKSLEDWVETEVRPFRNRSNAWMSQYYWFRDPNRPSYSDLSYFFSPADGIIVYQKIVKPNQSIVRIKGKAYSLKDALQDPEYHFPSLVIGIFMTFFDVHVNRIPYPGILSYTERGTIDTHNHPMVDVEKRLCEELRIPVESMGYLHHNQRMVNRVYSSNLGLSYYILQVADDDAACIAPFQLKQGQPATQGARFSQIRHGSQVDLIVPLSARFDFTPLQLIGSHVEAGLDPLIKVTCKAAQNDRL